jgi:hypothetical protein
MKFDFKKSSQGGVQNMEKSFFFVKNIFVEKWQQKILILIVILIQVKFCFCINQIKSQDY